MDACAKADAVERNGVDSDFIDMALQLADAAATVTTKFFRHEVSSSDSHLWDHPISAEHAWAAALGLGQQHIFVMQNTSSNRCKG